MEAFLESLSSRPDRLKRKSESETHPRPEGFLGPDADYVAEETFEGNTSFIREVLAGLDYEGRPFSPKDFEEICRTVVRMARRMTIVIEGVRMYAYYLTNKLDDMTPDDPERDRLQFDLDFCSHVLEEVKK